MTTAERPDRVNLALYLAGTASWFASMGVQTVLFAWLVTIELNETPEKVGLAQFSMMLPTLCLLLFGGVVADRVGGARVAFIAQCAAMIPVLALATLVAIDALVYPLLIAYALVMGTMQAFVTPARDGMLSQVAGIRIQRTVVLASLVQFGVQILGFSLAGLADAVGPFKVLGVQAGILALGAIAFAILGMRLRRADHAVRDPEAPPALRPRLAEALSEGLATVAASPPMRAVAAINVCVGMFFMGAFQVGVPLLVREVHGGTPGQLALVNTLHMVGIVAVTLVLLQLGDVERRGRALILGVFVGAVGLAGMGLTGSFEGLLLFNFLWGSAGGVVIEHVPDHHAGSGAGGSAGSGDGLLLAVVHGSRAGGGAALRLSGRGCRRPSGAGVSGDRHQCTDPAAVAALGAVEAEPLSARGGGRGRPARGPVEE
ncbi:MAG: MFS transporter [Gammaproteobacteria bacterium]|nr:MFS transporter [Gammaproteobacteria bacterium]